MCNTSQLLRRPKSPFTNGLFSVCEVCVKLCEAATLVYTCFCEDDRVFVKIS